MHPTAQLLNLKLTTLTCRLCLKPVRQGKSLFETLQPQQKLHNKHTTFADELMEITNVPVLKQKGVPHLICKECIQLMHQAYSFKKRYTVSQNILKAVFSAQAPEVKKQQQDVVKREKYVIVQPALIPIEQVQKATPQVFHTVDLTNLPTKDEEGVEEEVVDHQQDSIEAPDAPDYKSPEEKASEAQNISSHLFQCNFPGCDKVYRHFHARPRKPQENLDDRSSPEEKLYPCKYDNCDKVYHSYHGRYLHHKHIHRKHRKLCTVCGKHVIQMNIHMMRHNTETPFKCKQCPKSYKTKYGLRLHMELHIVGRQKHICSYCGKQYTFLNNLRSHEKIHMKSEDLHHCEVCNKDFYEEIYLTKHMLSHHKHAKKEEESVDQELVE